MVKNQLFKKYPQKDLVIQLLNVIGFRNFDDKKYITKSIIELDTLNKFEEYKSILKEYYIPCKYKLYFNNININRLITIIRQLLKIYGYTIKSKEKYINSKKELIYSIHQLKDNTIIINFD